MSGGKSSRSASVQQSPVYIPAPAPIIEQVPAQTKKKTTTRGGFFGISDPSAYATSSLFDTSQSARGTFLGGG